MKTSRNIILATFFLLQIVLVPSKAFPFGFGGLGGLGFLNENDRLPFENEDGDQQAPQDGGKKAVKPNNNNANLRVGFYGDSCPNAEQIVADALAEIVKTNPNAVANLLRLQFHDCFVVGCDASILLDYSPDGDKVEKNSFFNGQLLRGTDIIDDIKSKLEEKCPGTVSCADTMAFATNAGMAIAGLPRKPALSGRRDGLYSLATVVEDNNLPLPNWPMDKMVELFQRKGFTIEEMVILLGAHSIGQVHCEVFMDRAYNFEKTNKPDPALPLPILNEIKQVCANPGTPQFRNPPMSFDETPTVLDNLFYKNIVERKKTLLETDAHLITDQRAYNVVKQMAADEGLWQKQFADVMEKLSSLNVITGDQGEVRKTCRATN